MDMCVQFIIVVVF